jgi:glycosyltransferase involved in cell wall biosynthesis
MASYNGAKYIEKQIVSILFQLSIGDELIISDDSSIDNTVNIIRSFSDKRIVLLSNSSHSPTSNFENSLKQAKGEIVVLCDQDDIWLPNRLTEIKHAFEDERISLIINRYNIIDSNGDLLKTSPPFKKNPAQHSFIRNLIHNPYIGCCMAFRREILKLALPFPLGIPMHDSWIGLLAQFNGKCIYIDKALVNYRRHGGNVTSDKSPYSIRQKMLFRVILVYNVFKRTIQRKCKRLF